MRNLWEWMNEHPGKAWAIIILVPLLVRVVYVQANSKVIKGEPPVQTIDITEEWVTVNVGSRQDAHSLVNLRVFGQLNPDMGLEEIESIAGSEKAMRLEDRTSFHEFWHNGQRYEYVDSLTFDDEGNIDGNKTWLDMYPSTLHVEHFFSPKIAKHLPRRDDLVRLNIRDQNNRHYVSADIKGIRVERITWWE